MIETASTNMPNQAPGAIQARIGSSWRATIGLAIEVQSLNGQNTRGGPMKMLATKEQEILVFFPIVEISLQRRAQLSRKEPRRAHSACASETSSVEDNGLGQVPDHKSKTPSDFITPGVSFPADGKAREAYRTSSGKRLTPYQWKVYDYLLTIPSGKITTYKGVAQAVGGSPRSAGTALRSNPFAPYVPCHRVIASNLYIGGFFGEWAKEGESLPRVDQKRALLAAEGILFDEKGYLRSRQNLL
ncbi:hypothetical protein NMY22_g6246 [Coprinellus aureogranulatus]|nr:hypothetical protein NMY22_g6246 [Coprinellus aureogranulatus]